MNLSVELPADLEMYVWRDISLFAAPAPQTVVERDIGTEFAPDQHRSFLFHQESRPSSCRFLFPDVRTQQLVCDDIDDVEHGFQIPLSRSLLLSPSRVCGCRHVTGPDASQPTSIAPLPCVDDVVIRIVDRWQVTSGLFSLSRSRSARQLSRSRSVTRAQQRENSKHTVWSEV